MDVAVVFGVQRINIEVGHRGRKVTLEEKDSFALGRRKVRDGTTHVFWLPTELLFLETNKNKQTGPLSKNRKSG
jgi:hypothetical protein